MPAAACPSASPQPLFFPLAVGVSFLASGVTLSARPWSLAVAGLLALCLTACRGGAPAVPLPVVASRPALRPGALLLLLRLCAFALILDGAHAGCPGAAAPGYFCVGSLETQCPVGSFCTGEGAAAIPCLTPANCAVEGLSAEPPCVWSVTTLAGSGSASAVDGQGTAASFNLPVGVAVGASQLLYVADYNSNRIRAVSSSGLVSTLAGSGSSTWADGIGAAASFNRPYGVATYPGSSTIYVADTINHRVRMLTPSGVTTTFAGSGSNTWADGQGTSASFKQPAGLTVDSAGVVYVADQSNHLIRKITPLGAVTTLAGTGVHLPLRSTLF